ncbi:MAG: adenylate/guanylate cyclase domain-containing protein [Cetobacterium sp.]|nr:adenylate/guanylate cyclase domain-containing protein [Cetobacterium sp.]
MDKKTGVHFYLNIKNLDKVIKDEENKDEDLKRTLHRLQTYFVGLTNLVKDKGAKIEKYTAGRAHIVFELNNDDKLNEDILETICSCFIYANEIFNNLSKYSQYAKFSINAGVDFGDYYDYEIEDDKITSIGSVANISAKIQSYAKKNYLYATKKFIEKLDNSISDKFIRLDDIEYSELYDKVKIKNIYEIKYLDIFDEDKNESLLNNLEYIKDKVEDETKKINLKDIKFEDVVKKLSFDNLSLRGTNKRISDVAILCADIRGFTKLFTVSDSNLDDLKDVMKEIYSIMGSVVESFNGTLVQYQGDRLVSIYHDYDIEKDYIIRALESALTLKDKIIELSTNEDVKKKLNDKEISIGIGCSIGKVIATRLGMYGSKDNIVLGESYNYANKSEDEYANKKEIVIYKTLKEKLKSIADDEDNENIKYEVLNDNFDSIKTTGYYVTDITLKEYNNKLQELKNQKLKIDQLVEKNFNSREAVRPWGK